MRLVRGGLLVCAEAPALAQFSAIDLELVAPDEATLTLTAEVVQPADTQAWWGRTVRSRPSR
ncbi:MAG: hypothetical protein L6Q84_20965 [Polyangiaceae bacterium]|nr:hypothetical protein [Polyangiaceae bacterium]